jgi:hypothetical protein
MNQEQNSCLKFRQIQSFSSSDIAEWHVMPKTHQVYHLLLFPFINSLKPKPGQGSVCSNLLCGPCPSAACAYILHMYSNADDLSSGLGCWENFTEQPSIWFWCCHLVTFCCTIFLEGGTEHNQLFTVMWSVVCAVSVFF